MSIKKQKFAYVFALILSFALGMLTISGCAYFSQEKVAGTVTYEMAWQTKVARDRIKYPEEYRLLCSNGARGHNIKNNFTKKRKATK